MKRKILSIFICLTMCMTVLSTNVLADDAYMLTETYEELSEEDIIVLLDKYFFG